MFSSKNAPRHFPSINRRHAFDIVDFYLLSMLAILRIFLPTVLFLSVRFCAQPLAYEKVLVTVFSLVTNFSLHLLLADL